jgi:sulfur-oxidizing protein SoxX
MGGVMRNTLGLSFILVCSFSALNIHAAEPEENKNVAEGSKLAQEFCQACHQFAGTEQAGTVAPPLLGMKSRFPQREKLFNIIYDPQTAIKKDTMMPPFGRNELLAKDEIEKVIDFLYTL